MGNYANITQRLKDRHGKPRWTKRFVENGIRKRATVFRQPIPSPRHNLNDFVEEYWDEDERLSGIYFITYKGDDKCVKIGCSTKVPSRITSFLTGTWHDIDVLCLLQTSKAEITNAEKCAHELFESERCVREWFYLTDSVRSKINTIANMIKFKPFLLTEGGVPDFYETTN